MVFSDVTDPKLASLAFEASRIIALAFMAISTAKSWMHWRSIWLIVANPVAMDSSINRSRECVSKVEIYGPEESFRRL